MVGLQQPRELRRLGRHLPAFAELKAELTEAVRVEVRAAALAVV